MLPEISDYAVPVALVAVAIVLAALSTGITERIPSPAIFLLGAAIASDLSASLQDRIHIVTVERVAVVALVVILLNGGRDIGARRLRASLGAISSLGILGTFATAALLAVAAHVILGLEWKVAGVLGAALAPTDPAVMFSVLGRRGIAGRSGTVLEGEAGLNDPAGIALLLGLAEVATHESKTLWVVVSEFVVEMGIGVAAGLAGGWIIVRLLGRVRLGTSAMFGVLTIGLAGALYGGTTLAGGSGFLAVFVAGLMLGDARLPYGNEIDRFTSGLAGLAEVSVFLALGLTVHLGDIATRDWLGGLALLAVIALLVRPLVVATTLAGARLTHRERVFIAWSGLKGAVPVLLAAFAVLAGVPDAQRIYDLVFVVVLGSVVLQGGAVTAVATRLGLSTPEGPALPWELSVGLAEDPDDHLELDVAPGSPADGATVAGALHGSEAWITIIVRDARAIAPHPDTVLRAGDHVYLLGVEDDSSVARRFAALSSG